ncbi:hypothetical protein [Fodinicola feengrottensis]|uniref:hypothetical protein n=1 Tax=Fodinicola feengrottensis TaxID=435914 RepID=UPI0024431B09|nr:hypothetical protein [Fodinicola feengrottensis]
MIAGMKRMTQWVGRLSVALSGAIVAALVLPTVAWAHATPGVSEAVAAGGVLTLTKYRSRSSGSGIGLIGGGVVCCLIVVVGIVFLVVFLIRRNSN